jgi:hypothetical protein
MRKSLLSLATASVFAAGVGLAAAQSSTTTTTTETWNSNLGPQIRQYSETQHYKSFSDPSLNPSVGMELPGTVTLYPLPQTLKVPDSEQYSYSIINNHPVVVERSTRKVIHTWE